MRNFFAQPDAQPPARVAGKSTLLQVLGGKTMVDADAVRVLGLPPFHTTALTCDGELSYLGSQWRRTVASVGYDIALAGDVPARQMVFGVPGVDPARRDMLVSLLGVDLSWSMNRVSDGQRRRVQICLGLLKPYRVLLCDEITVDLDVVARVDLLNFFRRETDEARALRSQGTRRSALTRLHARRQRGATIIYATHIFDGMEAWPTHVAYVERGVLKRAGAAADVPVRLLRVGMAAARVRGADALRSLHLCQELFAPGDVDGKSRLLATMEEWLRAERDDRLANGTVPPGRPLPTQSPFAGRHMAYYGR